MIDFANLAERAGDAGAAAVVGAGLGLVFGVLAQRTGFCARSAFIDIGRGRMGVALPVWLAGFGAALVTATLAAGAGLITTTAIPLKVDPASVSGAVVGGLLFGAGMVLARGCASRHLVLAGTGNLRSWLTLAMFAIVASAAISGPLAPLRRAITGAWMISPSQNDLSAIVGGATGIPLALGVAAALAAIALAFKARVGRIAVFGGTAIGTLVTAGWLLTSRLAGQTFEPTQVETIAFTAPAANVLGLVLAAGKAPLSFDIGLIPAVVLGAAISSVFGGFRWQWFGSLAGSGRYVAGAALMGLGGVLALGCTVGALGNAALSVTVACLALLAMAGAAILTDRLVDAPKSSPVASAPTAAPSPADRLVPTGQFMA